MSAIGTGSNPLTKAVKWISENRQERPEARLFELVSEASRIFDLSPIEADTLFETILAEEKALKKE